MQAVSPGLSLVSPEVEVVPDFLSLYLSGQIQNCSGLYSLEPGEEWTLLDDGQLHHPGYGDTLLYCVENSVNTTLHVSTLILKCEEQTEEFPGRTDPDCLQNNRAFHVFFTALGIISLLFLIITFIVYVSIPDLFNLQGKIVLSNVTSIFLVTTYILIVYNVSVTSSVLCIFLGYFGYFVSISMFGWMTVICLDLCLTFCLQSPWRVRGDSDLSRFLLFSCMAWGTAALLTSSVAAADILLPPGDHHKPNVGLAECFIQAEGDKRMVFFHIPILVMMMINLVLYLATVYKLFKHSKQTADVRVSRR